MASDRFFQVTEQDIKSFSDELENTNTKKKISYDVKTLNEFLASEETRKFKHISADELQKRLSLMCLLCPNNKNDGQQKFYQKVKKKQKTKLTLFILDNPISHN